MTFVEIFHFNPCFKTNSTKHSCSFSLLFLLTEELKDQWNSKIVIGKVFYL